MNHEVILIVAVTQNGVIGRNGGMPWRLADDLKFFKEQTTGHPVVMGRATFKAIGKALPNRTNILVTRSTSDCPSGCLTAASLSEALQLAATQPGGHQTYIIGGGSIYAQVLDNDMANTLLLTRILTELRGDTYFPLPENDPSWQKISELPIQPADARNDYAFRIERWERRRA